MLQTYAQVIALVLAGAALGWIILFSFIVAPVAFRALDSGRAERLVRQIIKEGHGLLGLITLAAGAASLLSGAIAGAAIAAVAACFAFLCQFALAPRDDKPIKGHRVLKTARVVASGLTAFIAPVLLASIVMTRMGI